MTTNTTPQPLKTIKGTANYFWHKDSRNGDAVCFDYMDKADLKNQIQEAAKKIKEWKPEIKRIVIEVSNSCIGTVKKSYKFAA